MEAEAWLQRLVVALGRDGAAASAEGRGDRADPVVRAVTDDEREALLDLARIAAHTSERWTAPISTYLAGLALADAGADERGRVLRELVSRLE